jgi:hypothetical protein
MFYIKQKETEEHHAEKRQSKQSLTRSQKG